MSRRTRSGHRCVPLADWPAVDKAAWAEVTGPENPFALTTVSAEDWAPSTRRGIEGGYGRWLGWLEGIGALEPDSRPEERATFDRVLAYHDALKDAGLGDFTLCDRLRSLTAALKAMAPGKDWLWISRAATKIQRRAVPVRDIDARLQPIEEVVQLGWDLMEAADEGEDKSPMERAILFRDGLLVALMTHRPQRLANMTRTYLGQQLDLRGEDWWLSYGSGEMKGRRPLQCPIPKELEAPLERYLSIYRPILLGDSKPTRALWVSSQGNAFADGMVAQRITWRTQQRFGRSINPHSFRHLGASTLAEADPDNIADAARLLGHARLQTTEKHYIRAKGVEATRRHQHAVQKARRANRLMRSEPDA